MRRASLYSSSPRPRTAAARGAASSPAPAAAAAKPVSGGDGDAPALPTRRQRTRRFLGRHTAFLSLVFGVLLALGVVYGYATLQPPPHALTQDDIDSAVLHTLVTKQLPSQATRAYEAVRGSVVRVREFEHEAGEIDDTEAGVGTGVVIVDKGIILTNLHVVAGREEGRGRVRRRHRVRGERDRRAAGKRPGRAAGQDHPRRPAGRDDALHQGSRPRRRGRRRRLSRSASARRSRRASSRACAASSARPKASACSPT